MRPPVKRSEGRSNHEPMQAQALGKPHEHDVARPRAPTLGGREQDRVALHEGGGHAAARHRQTGVREGHETVGEDGRGQRRRAQKLRHAAEPQSVLARVFLTRFRTAVCYGATVPA